MAVPQLCEPKADEVLRLWPLAEFSTYIAYTCLYQSNLGGFRW